MGSRRLIAFGVVIATLGGCQSFLDFGPAQERVVYVGVGTDASSATDGITLSDAVTSSDGRPAAAGCVGHLFCDDFDDVSTGLVPPWDQAVQSNGTVHKAQVGHDGSPGMLVAAGMAFSAERRGKAVKTFLIPIGTPVTLRTTAWLNASVPLVGSQYVHVLGLEVKDGANALASVFFIRRHFNGVDSMQVYSGGGTGSETDEMPKAWVQIELSLHMDANWPAPSTTATATAIWSAPDGAKHIVAKPVDPSAFQSSKNNLSVELAAGVVFYDTQTDAVEIDLDDVTFDIDPN